MTRGAWWATIHGVAKSRTCLSVQIHIYTQASFLEWRLMKDVREAWAKAAPTRFLSLVLGQSLPLPPSFQVTDVIALKGLRDL